MAFTYRIDERERLVTLLFTGTVEFEQWKEGMEAVLADPRFRPGFDFLVDWTGVQSPIGQDLTERSSRYLVEHQEALGRSRRAIVIRRLYEYGMVRMAEAYSDGAPVDMRPFYSVAEALAWLRGDVVEGPETEANREGPTLSPESPGPRYRRPGPR